jgi:exonuclease III
LLSFFELGDSEICYTPGPKFDYKLRWFQRLADHARDLVNRDLPVILIGDYNVMPTRPGYV